MSDKSPEELAKELPAQVEVEPFARPDWTLAALVGIASGEDERGGNYFTLMVALNGLTVVGNLCSYGEWVKTLDRITTPTEEGQAFVSAIRDGFDDLTPHRDDEDSPKAPRQYFHMRDVSITGFGPQPIQMGGFRGRLAHVSGWAFPSGFQENEED